MNKINDLTISLLAIGLGLIVLLMAFNWWQGRKLRKAAEKQFSMPEEDVLMEEAAALALEPQILHAEVGISDINLIDDVEFEININDVEPTRLADDQALKESTDEAVMADQELFAPEHEAAITEAEPNLPPLQSKPLPDEYSPTTDLAAIVHLTEALSGERLRQFLMGMVNLDKPIFAYGLNQQHVWQPLLREQTEAQFNKVVYSIQLADRAGAITDETLKRFQQMVSELAYELSAQIEWVGSDDPLRFAQNLDAFCLEVDKMVGFHVVNGQAGRFTGTKFRGLAEANGMILREDGAFVMTDADAVLFTVVNMEKNPFNLEMLKTAVIKGVSFQMDLARTPQCTETFNRMVNIAKSITLALSGNLVDDHQRELSDAQIEKIRQQLKLIQMQMTVRGVPTGSPLALRLFS